MEMMKVINPATNEVVGEVPAYNGEELELMVDKAYKAQPAWEAVPLYERADILYRFCDIVRAHKEELGVVMAKEMGKPHMDGEIECMGATEIGMQHIEKAKHLYGEVYPDAMTDAEADLVFTRHEALGVVAAIIPFNFPIEMTIQKTVPALVMGNTVIVKAPTTNPIAVKMMVEYAHEAGVPEDAIQFVSGDRKVCTEHVLKNGKIAALALTGSTAAGSDMYRYAADSIKKIFLELGGNDAFIIREDADIDTAVEESIWGRVLNMGQICCAAKRFIVHSSIKDEYVEKLKKALDGLNRGSALEDDVMITCLVSEKAAQKVESQIKQTVEAGAKVVYGGTRNGAAIEPTILVDVTRDMDVAKDMEIFGPVFPVITFDTDEEAIAIANGSSYGLSGGILSANIMKALEMASKMESSGVVVNGSGGYRHNEQPFGGYKSSGIGNEGVSTTVEEYCRIKTYVLKGAFPK